MISCGGIALSLPPFMHTSTTLLDLLDSGMGVGRGLDYVIFKGCDPGVRHHATCLCPDTSRSLVRIARDVSCSFSRVALFNNDKCLVHLRFRTFLFSHRNFGNLTVYIFTFKGPVALGDLILRSLQRVKRRTKKSSETKY